jgi:dinuclear metal center YbgI/SA1388 family protein
VIGDLVWRFARAGVALYVAHTNWDAAEGGVNDALAERLGLVNVERFDGEAPQEEVKVVVFVPAEATDRVVDALGKAGAGEIGLYRRCAFYGDGRGTFEPQPGAHPAIGAVGAREVVDEMRLEMRAPKWAVPDVERAIRAAHPYEEPAYDIYPVQTSARQVVGRIGALSAPISVERLAEDVGKRLGSAVRVLGEPTGQVQRVAVVGGAGSDFVRAVKAANADVLVTGEARQHHIHDARFHGVPILEAGHAATELPGVDALARRLAEHFGAGLTVELV